MRFRSVALGLAILATCAAFPAPADAFTVTAEVQALAAVRGVSNVEAFKMLAAAEQIVGIELGKGLSSQAAQSLPMVYKSPTGWKAIASAASRLPYAAQTIGLALMGMTAGSAVAGVVYGDGSAGSMPGSNALWRFQYANGGRYLWVTPTWSGPSYGSVTGGTCPGSSTSWGAYLSLGYTVTQDSCGLTTLSAISGQTQQHIDVTTLTGMPETTESGKLLRRVTLPTAAADLYQRGTIYNGASSPRRFTLGAVPLPAYVPRTAGQEAAHDAQLVQELQDVTPAELVKVLSPPEAGGHYDPKDPATIATGTPVLKQTDDGWEVGPWDFPSEGPGVEADPTPAPDPTPTPSPTPTVKIGTTTKETTTTTTQNEDGSFTSIEVIKQPTPTAAVSFVKHFIDIAKNKAPFDWYLDAITDAAEQDLKWISWKDKSYNAESIEQEFDLNFMKPFLEGIVLVATIGLGVVVLIFV